MERSFHWQRVLFKNAAMFMARSFAVRLSVAEHLVVGPKGQLPVVDFWRWITLNLLDLKISTRIELGGSRRTARYRGPKPFRALYVSIGTLKSMQNRMGSQCNAARIGEI